MRQSFDHSSNSRRKVGISFLLTDSGARGALICDNRTWTFDFSSLDNLALNIDLLQATLSHSTGF